MLGCESASIPRRRAPVPHRSIAPSLSFALHHPGSPMPKYNYVAMDAHGKETKGTLEVATQNEAIGRVKEMGLFPTKIVETNEKPARGDKKAKPAAAGKQKKKGSINIKIPGLGGGVKTKVLTTFTR